MMNSLESVPLSRELNALGTNWKSTSLASAVVAGRHYERYISLMAPPDHTMGIAAYIRQDKPDTAGLNIRVRTASARNPHFTGANKTHLLVARIFDQFDNENLDVKHLEFSWEAPNSRYPLSDNFTSYFKAKRMLIEQGHDEIEAGHAACFETWTGQKVAKWNGFNQLTRLWELPGDNDSIGSVLGTFSRSS